MVMRKIKKNDTVIVIAGKDKGRTGSVTRIVGDRAFVDGINMVKKHVKTTKEKKGGIFPKESFIHMALLAYQSDEALLSTARLPHRGNYISEQFQGASLDHSIWFHQPVDVNDWLIYWLDSPRTGNARGYTRGEIYNARGVLVASCIQEGLMRMV